MFTANSNYDTLYALDNANIPLLFDAAAYSTTVQAYPLVGGLDTAVNHDPAHVTTPGFGVRHS